jgi:hypothetical protein
MGIEHFQLRFEFRADIKDSDQLCTCWFGLVVGAALLFTEPDKSVLKHLFAL